MTNFWEKNKIPVSIICGMFIVGLFIYFSRQSLNQTIPAQINPEEGSITVNIQSSSPTIAKEASQPTSTIAVSTVTLPPDDNNTAIRNALMKKTGIAEDNLEVTVAKNTGKYAKGSVRDKNEPGGAYFLAAKTSSGWVIVYDGQSQPNCQDFTPYPDFPKDLAPECLDTTGKVVKR
jgi:cytoskeletal protein RodZ